MPVHALGQHFDYFFGRLNPGFSFERQAASEHQSIIRLIEDASGPAAELSPTCFLQGSYRRQTAIYTINDIDIVALCDLRPPLWKKQRWRRDELFETIAAALRANPHYKDKVCYGSISMCIKVDLGIKVEILPVVNGSWFSHAEDEPFLLYRPEAGRWEDGYARRHQQHLSDKNVQTRTGGNFIPAIKVLKHIRSHHGLDVVSFHLECLLYSLPDRLFRGNAVTYIAAILHAIASESAETWYHWRSIKTPCQERRLFSNTEWTWERWKAFHDWVVFFDLLAQAACRAPDKAMATRTWQLLLRKERFPTEVSA
ncbi:MAG: SMODS domain-containing nucleotidyltransferase [Ktedonobacteraceae bacterium]